MTFLRSSSSVQDTAADPAPSEAIIGLVSATAEAQTRDMERDSMEAAGKVDNDDLHDTQKCTKDPILMRDYTYNLNVESIAQYPAKPRGSSRLLRVDEDGNVSHYDHFAPSFHDLAQGAHIVFNESKVANARVFVTDMANHTNCSDENDGGTSSPLPLEMMILDVGDLVACKASGLGLNVMLRKKDVQVGEVFVSETDSSCRFQVSKVIGEWVEDEHSNGNGSEVIVECVVLDANVTLAGLLDAVGSVPIPPYLNRSAEDSDVTDYNNVFASEAGSVAAPTAGLHFTNELLAQIGADNISYLSLHVGAGTFQPVMAENAADHKMHGENFHVNVRELQRIIEALEDR